MTIRERLQSQRDQVVARYEAGESMVKIAADFNCNPGTVWYFLDSEGASIRPRKGAGVTLRGREAEVRGLYEEGLTGYSIAKRLGVDKSTACRWLKKLGLSIAHNSKQRDDPMWQYADEVVAFYEGGDSTCEIAKAYGCSDVSVWKILQGRGVKMRPRAKYLWDETFFDRVDTEEKAYVLGWFYSDGNNMKGNAGVRIQITDLEILERIKVMMGYTGHILAREKVDPKHKTIHTLQVNSKRLSFALAALGCPPAKTNILRFPGEDIVSRDLIHHFVRGYNDGDGSIGHDKRGRRWRVQIVGTRHMMDGIVAACGLTSGVWFTRRHPDRPTDNWTLQIANISSVRRFLGWAYRDATVSLERKRLLAERFLLTYPPPSAEAA